MTALENGTPPARDLAAAADEPAPRSVRGLSSIFMRLLVGPAVGMVVGLLIFAIVELPPLAGIRVGACVGLVVGVLAGIIAWALFPYNRGL